MVLNPKTGVGGSGCYINQFIKHALYLHKNLFLIKGFPRFSTVNQCNNSYLDFGIAYLHYRVFAGIYLQFDVGMIVEILRSM